MKYTGKTRLRQESGLALIATLLVVVLVAGIIAAGIHAAMNVTRTVGADYRGARTFYAAEASAEATISQLELALKDGLITDAELADIEPPDLPPYDLSQFTIERIDTQRVETITDGSFAGLYALTQDIEITAGATDPSDAYAAVVLSVKVQAIPIFQFGVFYEEDLEIHPGPPMDFRGRVHSNNDIYLNSNNVWFYELITTPERAIWNYKPVSDRKSGVFILNASGDSVQLTFDSRDTPDPEQFKVRSRDDFDERLQTGAYGLQSLNLPLPPTLPPHEIVRPRETDDGENEKVTKYAWLADLYVTVDLSTVRSENAVCKNDYDEFDDDDDDSGKLPDIRVVRYNGGAVPDKETKCKIFGFSFETFFDSRELRPVDALDFDIKQLGDWIKDDSASNATRIIYVEFINSATPAMGTDDSSDGYYPVLRMKEGETLPGPLTIATEYPLYIWGDFNSKDKQPAAVAGDVYYVLSNKWDDSKQQAQAFQGSGRQPASNTTIYASILAGHQASDCDFIDDTGCVGALGDLYGGGLENYPRFLEDWKNVEYKYRGSIVSLWVGRIALGDWYCCSTYYRPPIRNWGFDLDLLDPAKLPPGTPLVGSVVRTSFREGGY